MKTFNQLVEDNGETAEIVPAIVKRPFSAVLVAFKDRLLKRKKKSEYFSTVKHIEKNYPGVNHFFLVASEWAEYVDPKKNPKLYKLLIELSKTNHLEDFSEAELKRVYKYIFNRHLKTEDDIKREFINAARDYAEWKGPDRRLSGNGYDGPDRRGDRRKLKSFSSFDYTGVDTKTMQVIRKKTGILKNLAKHITLSNVLVVSNLLTTLSGLYMYFVGNKRGADIAKGLRDLSKKVSDLGKAFQSGKDVQQQSADLSDDINIILQRASKWSPPEDDDPMNGHGI